MPKTIQGSTAWLVDDAHIPNDVMLKALDDGIMRTDQAELMRERIAKGGKQNAMVFLVTIGPKRLWCAFVGGSFDGEVLITPIGRLTLAALSSLPGVPGMSPIVICHIASAARLAPVATDVLLNSPDGSLIAFVGDVANELDGIDLEFMSAMGSVKAGVEIDSSGWPIEFCPLMERS